jgi:hypothetical protein
MVPDKPIWCRCRRVASGLWKVTRLRKVRKHRETTLVPIDVSLKIMCAHCGFDLAESTLTKVELVESLTSPVAPEPTLPVNMSIPAPTKRILPQQEPKTHYKDRRKVLILAYHEGQIQPHLARTREGFVNSAKTAFNQAKKIVTVRLKGDSQ